MKTNKKTALALILVFVMVSSSIVIINAPGTDADPANVIEVSYDHGRLVDNTTGLDYNGGDFTGELTLQYIPNRGYEFLSWQIEGSAVYSTKLNEITITSIQGTVNLTVIIRNYSTSQELINMIDVDDLPEPGDEMVLSWSFKSELLDRSGGAWKGMPSTPLIVEDTVYIRAGGRLYAVDMDSGSVKNFVISSTGSVSYYHYLDYGNGVIFDTVQNVAYDLNLNYLYSLPSNLTFATYHNGYFYGCLHQGNGYFTMYKTSLDIDTDLDNGVKKNLLNSSEQFHIFRQYGQFSNVQFVGDWFFFLDADMITGDHGYRAINAFNIVTEQSVTCRLTGFEGMPWDDGWLTYYDGYFYLTAYTAGLFDGVIKGLEDKRSSLMWVKFDFDNGRFEEPSYKNIQDPEGHEFRGIASGLVIYDGRGYLNVRALGTDTLGGSDDTGSKMIAYSIGENGEPMPVDSADSVMTHGGIVINTAHVDEGKVHVYLLPYNVGGQALYVFTDEYVDGQWDLKSTPDLISMARTDWCSQAIRAGPNGELLFYVDSGYIDCYVPVSEYWINVLTVDGGYVKSEIGYGKNVNDVLKKLNPSMTINGMNALLGDKHYYLYGLNEVTNTWVKITNPSVGTYSGTYNFGITESTFRYVVLLEQSSSINLPEDGEKGWYYFDGEYRKASFNDKSLLRASMGYSLFYLDSKPSVDDIHIKTSEQVNRDSTIAIELPPMDFTFTISDDDVISVVREGNTLSVTGKEEKTAEITVNIADKQYVISVNVLPKVTVEDGKTVTVSIRTDATEDGGTIHTESRTEESDTGIERTIAEIVRDSQDNVVSERHTTESKYAGLTMDGHDSDVIERTETLEENGVLKVDSEYYSETITARLDIGVIRVSSTESVKDNILNVKDITYIVRTEYASYDVSEVTVEHYVGDSVNPASSDAETVYESKQADFNIVSENGSVVINLDENGSVDVSGLISAATDDSSVNEIVINAGAIVNAKSVTSAAEAGASMAMDTGSVTISMGADTLKNLVAAGGNVKFSAESGAKMTAKQQSAVGDAKVFTINLTCGDVEQHDFGAFRLSVTCEITTQDGKELKAWRIDDYGKKTYATNVTYQDGVVSFDADHLSIYAIGYESESSGDSSDGGNNGGNNGMFLYAGIGAIAVLALLGAVFVMRRRA